MIKDNALANRLNAVKGGKEIPRSITEETIPGNHIQENMEEELFELPELSMRSMFLSSLLNLGEIAIMSFFYGFGIRTLMSQDWNILGIFGVGLLANQIFSLISSLKLFK